MTVDVRFENHEPAQTQCEPHAVKGIGKKVEDISRRSKSNERGRAPYPHQRIALIAQQITREQEECGQAAENVKCVLKEQVAEWVLHRECRQRHQHAHAILEPEERRPALQTDEDGEERIARMILMEVAEVDPHGRRPTSQEKRAKARRPI